MVHALSAGGAQRPPRKVQPKKKERFVWPSGRCWECGADDHLQPACPHYKKICGSDGKPPKGHMGAKAKALKAFKEKQAKQRQHMKALGYETMTDDTEDDDDDFATTPR